MLEPVEKTAAKRSKTPLELDAERRREEGLGPEPTPSQDFERPGFGQQYPIKGDVLWGWADYAVPGENPAGSEPGINPDLSSPSFPTQTPTPYQGLPGDERIPNSSPTIKFGGGGPGKGEIPPDEMETSPPSTAWYAPEPEYPLGGGYFSNPKTTTKEEPPVVTEEGTIENVAKADPEESGGGGFWQSFVDNSVIASTTENITNVVNNETTSNVWNTITENHITNDNIVNMITNHYTSDFTPDDSYWEKYGQMMGKAFDLSAVVGAVGAIPAAISSLGGTLAAAIAGAAVGGVARGATDGDNVVNVTVQSPTVEPLPWDPDQRYIGYGGGNSAEVNCEQLIQEFLAAGRDLSEIPEPCRSKIQT